MSITNLRGLKKPKRYKIMKGMGLVCVLFMVSIAAVACNRSAKDSIDEKDKTKEMVNQPTDMPSAEPTPTKEPETTEEPTPTSKPEGAVEPTPAGKPTETLEPEIITDFVPSEEVVHSTGAFTQGNYLFYKSGKRKETVIVAKNLKTSKETEIVTIEGSDVNSSEFYLKGSYIYYQADGDIYQIGVSGKNKNRLYKGTATILGFQEDAIFALDKKSREIIRINLEGIKVSLVKLNSIDTLEAVMVQDGLYYINKSSNNTLKGNDPKDRLYYIDFDGKNKTEIDTEMDIYDLKSYENDLYFLSVSLEPGVMKLNKVKNREVITIHSSSKEDLEAQGCNWFEPNSFTLLAVNNNYVYYGVDFNNGEDMNIYSVKNDGGDFSLFLNAYNIKGINKAAYFMRGNMEEGYLEIVFDCDEDPVEIYLIDLQDKSSIKFDGGYYISSSIDVEGEYVYYCKSSQYDPYGEMPDAYEYGYSKISMLQ
ncbi:MAG: putative secreted protein [Herbinix sp.]|jgi:hypothetical protein|nr:putative secreted protein [Herbinix sp.]